MLVEGGSQEIASILSDFYAPTFKDAFQSWLSSVPNYPKPFEFRMDTITDLLNMNMMDMFENQDLNTTKGCANAKYGIKVPFTNISQYLHQKLSIK